MVCLVGLAMLASCKKDPVAPTIEMYVGDEGTTCVIENAQVFSGDQIFVGFKGTGEEVTKIDVTVAQNGTALDAFHHQWNTPVNNFEITCDFTIEASGTVSITGTVTNAAGQTATKSFNIIYNEKPSAKFLGNYEGNALFTGTTEVAVAGMEPMQQEVTDHEMPVTLSITEGEHLNEVIAVCKINNQESTVTGTVEGDKVNFVLTDVPYTFDYDMSEISFSPTITMNLNLTATLVGSQLNLDGTCNGEGEVHILFYNGTIAIDGTIGGSLDKTE